MEDGIALDERVLECTEQSQSWTFKQVSSKPIASILRDFSAPVRLEHDLSFDDLVLLASADSDPFNRWQAGQEVAKRVLLEQIAAYEQGTQPTANNYLNRVFKATLSDDSVDGALRALALSLPNAKELAQEFTTVPVEAIHRVRDYHVKHLAQVFANELEACYNSLAGVDPNDRSVLARQQRRLRHACFAYLLENGDKYIDLAAKHYAQKW